MSCLNAKMPQYFMLMETHLNSITLCKINMYNNMYHLPHSVITFR